MEEDVELRPFVYRMLFNRGYVKTEKVPKDLARIFNDLFERRQESDYIDFVSFQEQQAPHFPHIRKRAFRCNSSA